MHASCGKLLTSPAAVPCSALSHLLCMSAAAAPASACGVPPPGPDALPAAATLDADLRASLTLAMLGRCRPACAD